MNRHGVVQSGPGKQEKVSGQQRSGKDHQPSEGSSSSPSVEEGVVAVPRPVPGRGTESGGSAGERIFSGSEDRKALTFVPLCVRGSTSSTGSGASCGQEPNSAIY